MPQVCNRHSHSVMLTLYLVKGLAWFTEKMQGSLPHTHTHKNPIWGPTARTLKKLMTASFEKGIHPSAFTCIPSSLFLMSTCKTSEWVKPSEMNCDRSNLSATIDQQSAQKVHSSSHQKVLGTTCFLDQSGIAMKMWLPTPTQVIFWQLRR